jgi:HAD superfamily hydrolase (TIGR01662 family)
MKISAVLFDLDGTLTDSTTLFHDAVAHGLSCFDIAMEVKHFDVWHTNHAPWKHLFSMHGKDECEYDETEIERLTMEKFDELLAKDIRWMEGAEQTVRTLKKRGMPIAIVTNSLDYLIDTMDKALPLKELFSIIITASLTKERRKPDPYGLLLAAERLGAHPGDCMYVGDQRFDMLAAQAAGMHDCLFAGKHTPADVELMAKHRIQNLPEVLKLID